MKRHTQGLPPEADFGELLDVPKRFVAVLLVPLLLVAKDAPPLSFCYEQKVQVSLFAQEALAPVPGSVHPGGIQPSAAASAQAAVPNYAEAEFIDRVREAIDNARISLETVEFDQLVDYLKLPMGFLWGTISSSPATIAALKQGDMDAWDAAMGRLRESLATRAPNVNAAQSAVSELIQICREYGLISAATPDPSGDWSRVDSRGLLAEDQERADLFYGLQAVKFLALDAESPHNQKIFDLGVRVGRLGKSFHHSVAEIRMAVTKYARDRGLAAAAPLAILQHAQAGGTAHSWHIVLIGLGLSLTIHALGSVLRSKIQARAPEFVPPQAYPKEWVVRPLKKVRFDSEPYRGKALLKVSVGFAILSFALWPFSIMGSSVMAILAILGFPTAFFISMNFHRAWMEGTRFWDVEGVKNPWRWTHLYDDLQKQRAMGHGTDISFTLDGAEREAAYYLYELEARFHNKALPDLEADELDRLLQPLERLPARAAVRGLQAPPMGLLMDNQLVYEMNTWLVRHRDQAPWFAPRLQALIRPWVTSARSSPPSGDQVEGGAASEAAGVAEERTADTPTPPSAPAAAPGDNTIVGMDFGIGSLLLQLGSAWRQYRTRRTIEKLKKLDHPDIRKALRTQSPMDRIQLLEEIADTAMREGVLRPSFKVALIILGQDESPYEEKVFFESLARLAHLVDPVFRRNVLAKPEVWEIQNRHPITHAAFREMLERFEAAEHTHAEQEAILDQRSQSAAGLTRLEFRQRLEGIMRKALEVSGEFESMRMEIERDPVRFNRRQAIKGAALICFVWLGIDWAHFVPSWLRKSAPNYFFIDEKLEKGLWDRWWLEYEAVLQEDKKRISWLDEVRLMLEREDGPINLYLEVIEAKNDEITDCSQRLIKRYREYKYSTDSSEALKERWDREDQERIERPRNYRRVPSRRSLVKITPSEALANWISGQPGDWQGALQRLLCLPEIRPLKIYPAAADASVPAAAVPPPLETGSGAAPAWLSHEPHPRMLSDQDIEKVIAMIGAEAYARYPEIAKELPSRRSELVGIYPGSAADVISYFRSTKAKGGIFLGMESFKGERAHLSEEDAAYYDHAKAYEGGTWGQVLYVLESKGYGIEAIFRHELESMRAQEVKVQKIGDSYRITFEWDYFDGEPLVPCFIHYRQVDVKEFLAHPLEAMDWIQQATGGALPTLLVIKQSGIETFASLFRFLLAPKAWAVVPHWKLTQLGETGVKKIAVIHSVPWGSDDQVAVYELENSAAPAAGSTELTAGPRALSEPPDVRRGVERATAPGIKPIAEVDQLAADPESIDSALQRSDMQRTDYFRALRDLGLARRKSNEILGIGGYIAVARTYVRILKHLKRLASPLAGKRVLEIGPGGGGFLLALKDLGMTALEGLEKDDVLVQALLGQGISVVSGDFLFPPVGLKPAAIVCSLDVLNLLDPMRQELAWTRLAAMSIPCGIQVHEITSNQPFPLSVIPERFHALGLELLVDEWVSEVRQARLIVLRLSTAA